MPGDSYCSSSGIHRILGRRSIGFVTYRIEFRGVFAHRSDVMFYSIRHITQFVYSAAVSESSTEVRMQPRAEALQRCLGFELGTNPRAKVSSYRDRFGNVIHHFDVPGQHSTLRIIADSRVECLQSR